MVDVSESNLRDPASIPVTTFPDSPLLELNVGNEVLVKEGVGLTSNLNLNSGLASRNEGMIGGSFMKLLNKMEGSSPNVGLGLFALANTCNANPLVDGDLLEKSPKTDGVNAPLAKGKEKSTEGKKGGNKPFGKGFVVGGKGSNKGVVFSSPKKATRGNNSNSTQPVMGSGARAHHEK